MYFVDCCVRVGRSPTVTTGHLDLDAIEQLYRRHGIAHGLAYHVLASEYDPLRGNEALMALIEGRRAFSPLLTVPLNSDPDADPVAGQIERVGARAVIAFPEQHGYKFLDWVAGPWLDWLCRRQIALWVPVAEVDLAGMVSALRGFPELVVVLLGTRYQDHAMLHSAMRALPRLWVDLSQHHVFDGVRRLAGPFGPERLVFGSGLPEFSPGSPRYQVLRSGLAGDDLAKVCHGNLERLLGVGPFPDAGVKAGLPCPVVDVHAHAGRWPRYGIVDEPSDWLIGHVERAGVRAAALANIFEGDRRRGNDRTAALVAQRPGRWLGYATVSPSDGEQAVTAELERCRTQLGFRGVKVYPPHDKLALADRLYEPVLKFADRHGWPVLIHGCPVDVGEVADRFPAAAFILGHSASETPAIQACREHANVYVEVCSSARERTRWVRGLNAPAADKVLFGSDFPLIDPAAMLGAVMDVVDDPERLRMVLMANGAKLLGLDVPALTAESASL